MNLTTQSANRSLQVEILSRLQQLQGLAPEWWALWQRCPTASPFQAPDWGIAWWSHFGSGHLSTLALRDSGRLVGLAPFYATPSGSGGQRLLLIGTGLTDYLDVLLEPESHHAGLQMLTRTLDGWDFDSCDFQQLPEHSLLLDANFSEHWQSRCSLQEVCPVLTLSNGPEDPAAAIPPSLRLKIQYYRRRLQQFSTWSIESATSATLPEYFDALITLHQKRWAIRGQPGVLAQIHVQRFHSRVAEGFLEKGLLRLYALRAGGSLIAILYGFLAHRRMYYYLGAFDPDYAAFSPGVILIAHAIEESSRQGAVAFDFLRGAEPYKYSWGAVDTSTHRLELSRKKTGPAPAQLDSSPPLENR